MLRQPIRALFLAAAAAAALTVPASALYVVQPLGAAPISQDLARERGWPAGVLEVVNHRLRVQGWDAFFSGLPNDRKTFGYRLTSAAEANRLLRKLASIEGEKPSLILSVEPSFRFDQNDRGSYQAAFTLGSQKILDAWWKRLPDGKFGVQVYPEPPKAQLPQMTLYLGGGRIDPGRLHIPAGLRTSVLIPEELRGQEALQPLIRELQKLAAEQRAR